LGRPFGSEQLDRPQLARLPVTASPIPRRGYPANDRVTVLVIFEEADGARDPDQPQWVYEEWLVRRHRLRHDYHPPLDQMSTIKKEYTSLVNAFAYASHNRNLWMHHLNGGAAYLPC